MAARLRTTRNGTPRMVNKPPIGSDEPNDGESGNRHCGLTLVRSRLARSSARMAAPTAESCTAVSEPRMPRTCTWLRMSVDVAIQLLKCG
jgi:hypothetical protein